MRALWCLPLGRQCVVPISLPHAFMGSRERKRAFLGANPRTPPLRNHEITRDWLPPLHVATLLHLDAAALSETRAPEAAPRPRAAAGAQMVLGS